LFFSDLPPPSSFLIEPLTEPFLTQSLVLFINSICICSMSLQCFSSPPLLLSEGGFSFSATARFVDAALFALTLDSVTGFCPLSKFFFCLPSAIFSIPDSILLLPFSQPSPCPRGSAIIMTHDLSPPPFLSQNFRMFPSLVHDLVQVTLRPQYSDPPSLPPSNPCFPSYMLHLCLRLCASPFSMITLA